MIRLYSTGWRAGLCVALTVAVLAATACRTTPITGRRQLLVVPESNEISMGISAFQDTLKDEQLSSNQAWVEMVQRVGNRIAAVANRPDYDWEFQLIASPEKNAFALPGGKVAIYEGILPICYNEAGLAVVMSHEIAHALARHGGERMTHQYAVNGVGWVLDLTAKKYAPGAAQRVGRAYGLASKYGFTLPYSRKHESEADHMGAMLMAQAGYDPREAPAFWMRFGTAQQGEERPIEFLSTHPSDERRAVELRALMPQAMEYYQTAQRQYGLGAAIDFPQAAVAQAPPASPPSTEQR